MHKNLGGKHPLLVWDNKEAIGADCAISPTRLTDRLPNKHDVKLVACMHLLSIHSNIF